MSITNITTPHLAALAPLTTSAPRQRKARPARATGPGTITMIPTAPVLATKFSDEELLVRQVDAALARYVTGRPIALVIERWVNELRVSRRPITIAGYVNATVDLLRYLSAVKGLDPASPAEITTEHYADYLNWLRDVQGATSGGRVNKYKAQRQFFRWAVVNGYVATNVTDRLKPAHTDKPAIDILTPSQITALLDSTRTWGDKGPGNVYRLRDEAIIRLFVDTGARSGEIAGLRLTHDPARVDFEGADVVIEGNAALIRLVGKDSTGGQKERWVNIVNRKTLDALRAYITARAEHPYASSHHLFIGKKGPAGTGLIGDMLERRANHCDIDHVHPHQFRHTLAHHWMKEGRGEQALADFLGWSSTAMCAVYASTGKTERAHLAHAQLSYGKEF